MLASGQTSPAETGTWPRGIFCANTPQWHSRTLHKPPAGSPKISLTVQKTKAPKRARNALEGEIHIICLFSICENGFWILFLIVQLGMSPEIFWEKSTSQIFEAYLSIYCKGYPKSNMAIEHSPMGHFSHLNEHVVRGVSMFDDTEGKYHEISINSEYPHDIPWSISSTVPIISPLYPILFHSIKSSFLLVTSPWTSALLVVWCLSWHQALGTVLPRCGWKFSTSEPHQRGFWSFFPIRNAVWGDFGQSPCFFFF